MKSNFNIAFKAFGMSALAIGLFLPMTAQAEIAHPSAMTLNSVTEKAQLISTSQDEAVELLVQNMISASEAKSIAQRKVRNGEVVDISRNGGVYRVRMIRKDGRVIDVFIDAKTGRVQN